MNATNRKTLRKLGDKLSEVLDGLRTMGEEELEKFEALPDGLMDTERGQLMDTVANNLEEMVDELDGVLDRVNDIADGGEG